MRMRGTSKRTLSNAVINSYSYSEEIPLNFRFFYLPLYASRKSFHCCASRPHWHNAVSNFQSNCGSTSLKFLLHNAKMWKIYSASFLPIGRNGCSNRRSRTVHDKNYIFFSVLQYWTHQGCLLEKEGKIRHIKTKEAPGQTWQRLNVKMWRRGCRAWAHVFDQQLFSVLLHQCTFTNVF